MKSVIVGTAGHIDHGKTALVKALTGIDADRLEEEKRRGITIDIGFAHLELPGAGGEVLRLGFVDVPGHERFVRNMLAGVGGIDLVLLVIAADESIKPQTREHFDICRLLAVRRGLTVLTKSDLVDEETLDVVRLEVEEFLRGSFLDSSTSPIIPVSALSGAGISELKAALAKIAEETPAKDSAALARLPIDRVFSMKGFGTVVTGTLLAGAIRKDEELEVFPSGKKVRVRGVQIHGEPAEQAIAGQRTALNLTGVTKEDLSRGMTLAPAALFQATARVGVELSMLPATRPLKDGSRVHFHAHTMETTATVLLSGKKQAAAGETSIAQLRLDHASLLLPGDRFILRQFSPVVTIGGGVVLDAAPLPRTRRDAQESFLRLLANAEPMQALKARIDRRGRQGLSLAQAVAETGRRGEQLQRDAEMLIRQGSIAGRDDFLVEATALAGLKQQLLHQVADFQKQNPLVPGINKEALREASGTSSVAFTFALEALAKEKKLELSHEVVRQPGTGVVLKDEEAESKKLIEAAFATAGLKVPGLKDVLAPLKVDKVRAQKIVTLLLRDKVLIKIADDLVFHQAALADLRKRIAAEKLKSPRINVAQFKDLTGVSRKYAIPLLEYLDREHVTRRVGDERVIL